MDSLKGLVATSALVAIAFISSSAAQAATLKFTMAGDDNYTWTMDSDPTPSDFELGGTTISNVGSFDAIRFHAGFLGGGLTSFTPGFPPASPFDYQGPQIYSSDSGTPHFSVGVYVMTINNRTNSAANETLTISALATPLPAALPLFVSGLGGLGFLGWRRRATTA